MNQFDEPMVITFQSDEGLLVFGPWVNCDHLPGHSLDLTTHLLIEPEPQVVTIPAPGGLALTGLALLVLVRRRRIRR